MKNKVMKIKEILKLISKKIFKSKKTTKQASLENTKSLRHLLAVLIIHVNMREKSLSTVLSNLENSDSDTNVKYQELFIRTEGVLKALREDVRSSTEGFKKILDSIGY